MKSRKSYKNVFRVVISLGIFFIGLSNTQAQYYVNGDAQQLSCNCYRLTEENTDQSGSVWNTHQISLEDPFDFTFDVYLGVNELEGADGIAFVLQPIDTTVGSLGGGLGYEGITPSIAIEIDTYKNAWDPPEDHIAFQANGDTDHSTANNLAGPAIVLVSGASIEDGQWHVMRVSWDPITLTLRTYMDGSLRLSYVGDIVTNYLLGDPMVYWGFTGSTGWWNNVQEFCLNISPGLASSTGVNAICEGDSILFEDNSFSALGDIVSWTWDFRNGETSTDQNPGEVPFTDAGTYWVTQVIVDAAGCDATDSLEITVNPNPEAAFTATDACEGTETVFQSQSTISTGSVDNWDWDFGNGTVVNGNLASVTYADVGTYNVELTVSSNLGCTDTVAAAIIVNPNPEAAFTATDACEGTETVFQSQSTISTGSVDNWDWDFGNGDTINGNPASVTYAASGTYNAELAVSSNLGCTDTIVVAVTVNPNPQALFTGDSVCLGETTYYTDESVIGLGTVDVWRWNLGNGVAASDSIASTTYAEAGEYEVFLHVTTGLGCVDSVISTFLVYENPVPNVTSESLGLEANFTIDSVVGEVVQWGFPDITFDNISTVNYTFQDSGWYDISLMVENENGCIETLIYSIHIERPEYVLSNVFSPNGDGVNDLFQPYGYGKGEAKLEIFSRWGRVVFSFEGGVLDGDDWGWDGTINGGTDAASGTYYYILDLNGNSRQGAVLLVR